MGMKPNEIINSLSPEDQGLLNSILSIEKSRLHIHEVKKNSRTEKEIVSEIVSVIDKVVKDDT